MGTSGGLAKGVITKRFVVTEKCGSTFKSNPTCV